MSRRAHFLPSNISGSVVQALLLSLLSVIAVAAPCRAAVPDAAAPANPQSVQLSPNGGLFMVQEDAAVTTENGMSVISLVLPAGAENLRLQIPGQTIARWTFTPQPLKHDGALSRLREKLRMEKEDIEKKLVTVTGRMDLWKENPKLETYKEKEQTDKMLQAILPALHEEHNALQQRQKLVNEELGQLEKSAALGKRVSVILHKAPAGGKVRVEYSYTLSHCGWRPVYSFSARTEGGGNKDINVRLMAEVWQLTGIDWKNVRLSLVTRGMGPREPAALPRWTLDSNAKADSRKAASAHAFRGRGAGLQDTAVALEEAPSSAKEAPLEAAANAPVTLASDGLYASWDVSANGLEEGRSRLLIVEDNWQTPLQWLARPGRRDSRVWLVAKYTLPAGQVWPDGHAEFSVNGQSVGSGVFKPVKGEARLFFGEDPRVTLTATDDTRTRGESGFIDKRRHWRWAWTYTLTNRHGQPVTVRLERPAPVAVDERITVRHEDEPAARKEERNICSSGKCRFRQTAPPASGMP